MSDFEKNLIQVFAHELPATQQVELDALLDIHESIASTLAAFGQHDISHVQAYTGSQAAQASKAIGAEAYATVSKVAFANPNPSLHTVAHEAAHVIQHGCSA